MHTIRNGISTRAAQLTTSILFALATGLGTQRLRPGGRPDHRRGTQPGRGAVMTTRATALTFLASGAIAFAALSAEAGEVGGANRWHFTVSAPFDLSTQGVGAQARFDLPFASLGQNAEVGLGFGAGLIDSLKYANQLIIPMPATLSLRLGVLPHLELDLRGGGAVYYMHRVHADFWGFKLVAGAAVRVPLEADGNFALILGYDLYALDGLASVLSAGLTL
jgi:hypothetical protein